MDGTTVLLRSLHTSHTRPVGDGRVDDTGVTTGECPEGGREVGEGGRVRKWWVSHYSKDTSGRNLEMKRVHCAVGHWGGLGSKVNM